jgi:hypothetical protein
MNEGIEIERIGACNTLSGASALTYHVGNAGDGGLLIRLYGNSGRGLFCKEWVSLRDIDTLLSEYREPFSSKALYPVFKGKSANSAGFLMAVLLKEGLVIEPKGSGNGFARGNSVANLVTITATDGGDQIQRDPDKGSAGPGKAGGE